MFDRVFFPCDPLPQFYDDFPHLLGRSRPPTPSRRPVGIAGSADTRTRLAGLLRTVNAATEGNRNATLHWAACRAGEMVAAGLIRTEDAADALTAVGLAVGLDPSEVRGTIRSGVSTSGVLL